MTENWYKGLALDSEAALMDIEVTAGDDEALMQEEEKKGRSGFVK